jgi:hypothetical protein
MLACSSAEELGTGGTAGAGGGVGGTSATGGNGGQANSGGGPTMTHPGVLADDGLIARYYLDEAASGQGPTDALDAAPDPLDLALRYVGDPVTLMPVMSYTEDDGNRGLAFTTQGLDDVAFVAVDQTKVAMALQGGTTMTYEVVATIKEVNSSSSRLMHVGTNQDHTLSLETSGLSFISLEVNSLGSSQAPAPLPDLGRAVYHGVLDTAVAEPSERVKLYANGSRIPTLTVATMLDQDTPIDLGTGKFFAIGNREEGGRTIQGVIYYAAVYQSALTPEQVAQNTALLLIDDDTPTPR